VSLRRIARVTLSRGSVCSGESGLAHWRRVAWRIGRVAHVAQDLSSATRCFPIATIAAAAAPVVILGPAVCAALVVIRLRLVRHIVCCLRGGRCRLILTRRLRDTVRGRRRLISRVWLRRALLVGVAVRIVIVRRHDCQACRASTMPGISSLECLHKRINMAGGGPNTGLYG
jgi:hypothetical protein